MKLKRIYFGILLVVILLGSLVFYEWYSALKKTELIKKHLS